MTGIDGISGGAVTAVGRSPEQGFSKPTADSIRLIEGSPAARCARGDPIAVGLPAEGHAPLPPV